jgi:hypothetical protein
MSENLKKLFLQLNPVSTKSGAAMRVTDLFYEIEAAHGSEAARLMFERWAKEPTPAEIIKLKGWRILERYDLLPLDEKGRKNKAQLAREIVVENEALPDDEQVTPRRRPTFPTVYAYIGTLLRERRDAMEAGTWDGPDPDPLGGPIVLEDGDL